MDDSLSQFRIWLVMYSLDMLVSQHQISWPEVHEGLKRVEQLRFTNPVSPIPQPEFDARLIKGHTPVSTSFRPGEPVMACPASHESDEPVQWDFSPPGEEN
jgi:hypothetical protein